MEKTPVITFSGSTSPKQIEESYSKWITEAYYPLAIKLPSIDGIVRYRIINEQSDYSTNLTAFHFKTILEMEDFFQSPELKAFSADVNANWNLKGRETLWSMVYQLVKNFGAGQNFFLKSETDAPQVMQILAFNVSPQERDRFDTWFTDYGDNGFLPVFLKAQGVTGYSHLKWTGVNAPSDMTPKVKDYPHHLSLIYFNSLKAAEDFEKSPEMISFRGAIRALLPSGSGFRWNVKYQLQKSWKK